MPLVTRKFSLHTSCCWNSFLTCLICILKNSSAYLQFISQSNIKENHRLVHYFWYLIHNECIFQFSLLQAHAPANTRVSNIMTVEKLAVFYLGVVGRYMM